MFKKIVTICLASIFFGNHGYAAEKIDPLVDEAPVYHDLFKYDSTMRPSDHFFSCLDIDPQALPDDALHSDKVYIRLPKDSDESAYLNLYKDTEYTKYDPHVDEDKNKRLFRRVIASNNKRDNDGCEIGYSGQLWRNSQLIFMVCQITDNAVVGAISFHFSGYNDAHLEYIIDQDYSRRGYATDALNIAVNLIKHVRRANCACAQIHPDNAYSRHVVKRNGFKYYKKQESGVGFLEYSISFDKNPKHQCNKACAANELTPEHLKELSLEQLKELTLDELLGGLTIEEKQAFKELSPKQQEKFITRMLQDGLTPEQKQKLWKNLKDKRDL